MAADFVSTAAQFTDLFFAQETRLSYVVHRNEEVTFPTQVIQNIHCSRKRTDPAIIKRQKERRPGIMLVHHIKNGNRFRIGSQVNGSDMS